MPLRRRLLAGVAILASALVSVPAGAGAAAAPATAVVTGTVTFPAGETWDLPVKVQLQQGPTYWDEWVSAADPVFSFTVPAGAYTGLWFARPENTTANVLSGSWSSIEPYEGFVVEDGETLLRDHVMQLGGSISGRITRSDGQPLANARAEVCTATSCYVKSAWTDANGVYQAVGLKPGAYYVRFIASRPQHYREAWAPNASPFESRAIYTVALAQQLTGMDAALVPYAAITGSFTKPVGMAGINVLAVDAATGERAEGAISWVTSTGATSGTFIVEGLSAGDYRLSFVEDALTPVSWWPDAADEASASIISLADGEEIAGLHTDIRGILLTGDIQTTAYTGRDLRVLFHRFDSVTGSYEVYAWTHASTFRGRGKWLPPGRYHVQAIDPERQYGTQYWPGTPRWSEAVDVTTTSDLDFLLEEQYVYTDRTSGADRFEVSARIGSVFGSGVPVAYVVNGLNFPDALSAAPAAIVQGGPLLLVTPTGIPAPIAARLDALNPEQIVVVGGPSSVSDAVVAQLATFVPTASPAAEPVVRISGTDRFAASRALARFAFGDSGADVAYLATGLNFPDALSAGAVAGHRGAPVILVNGLQPTIDDATRELLDELGVEDVVIAGGPNSVSPGIQSSLESAGFDVVRRSGADRFEASWSINSDFPGPAEDAFIAVGTKYPDALSGAAWAGYWNAPLYVVPPTCVPATVIGDIFALDVVDVHLLGGPASLSDDVLYLTACESG